MKAYVKGEWDMAQDYFNKALDVEPNDGPSKCIYTIMKDYQFKKPADWQGFRWLEDGGH